MVVNAVPENYDGRLPAWIKHQLLEAYFAKLLLIIGMAAKDKKKVEICYVDCFAGPWGDETDHMEGTSIAISLRTMAWCKHRLAEMKVEATMRAMYIELDKRAYGRLEAHLQTSTPAGVEASCRFGDFLDLRQEILSWAGDDAFTFFFIDPKGWKDVGVQKLQPLLERPRSEFLINFIYDFINRTASMAQWQSEIAEFLGAPVEAVQMLSGQSPEFREKLLLGSYRAGLKARVPFKHSRFRPRTAYVRVMDADKERPKYHMVYLSTHPTGIIKFMSISEEVEVIQHRVRAAMKSDARAEQTGTADMFAQDDEVDLQRCEASPGDVDKFWIDNLSEEPRQIDVDLFASFLETTDWMPGDLQKSLARLIAQGRVRNLNAKGKRPVRPLHPEADESLVLTGGKGR